jgi:hypothetical protein
MEFEYARGLSAAGIALSEALFHRVADVSTSCLTLRTRNAIFQALILIVQLIL